MSSYGLWLSAAGMKVQEHRQTLLANNLANANTTGFKEDLAVITQRAVESREDPAALPFAHPVLDALPGGLNVRPPYTSFAPGANEWTGNPLDVAVAGDGFLAVGDGTVTRYTRNGQLSINPASELVLTDGEGRWKVLDDRNRSIRVDPAAGRPVVTDDGSVRQGEAMIGRIALYTTDDKQALVKRGENLFSADGVQMRPADAHFVPGSREQANTDMVKGLVGMVEIARAYELNANLVQLQDHVTGLAVTTVGRVS